MLAVVLVRLVVAMMVSNAMEAHIVFTSWSRLRGSLVIVVTVAVLAVAAAPAARRQYIIVVFLVVVAFVSGFVS